MYPHDNIFNIYYNIGKRTPFLVKRCELGLARSSSEERRIDPNRDRTFLVETVKPRGKYGKAYGKCFMNGKPDDTYRKECYPNIKDEEIPCAGCGEWVLMYAERRYFKSQNYRRKYKYIRRTGRRFGRNTCRRSYRNDSVKQCKS